MARAVTSLTPSNVRRHTARRRPSGRVLCASRRGPSEMPVSPAVINAPRQVLTDGFALR